MNEALNAAIDELRDQLATSIEAIKEDPKMSEVLKLHSALNTMEGLVGAAPTSLAAAFALEPSMIVQPGEFYGMNALRAAKRFLKMKGKAGASLPDIVIAVRAGGAKIESVDKLRVSLGRSTLDVAKVGLDHYSLLEFFPHVQRGKKGKTSAEGEPTDDDDEEEDQENGDQEKLSGATPDPPGLSLEDDPEVLRLP